MIKKSINIIIFCIAVISVPAFLIIFFYKQSVLCLLLTTLVLGYVIVETIKFGNGNNKLVLSDLTPVLSIMISIIFPLIPFNNPPIKEQLNRLYFPKDSIDFEQEIITVTQTQNFLKLIFAFDNSGEGLQEKIDDNLQKQFEDYCDEIESNMSLSWANNQKEKINKFKRNNTYGNYLKAKLCFELIQRINDDGEFVVLKIGDPNKNDFNDGFKSLSKDNIKKAIQKILSTSNNELYTNFHTFNNQVENLKNNINQNEQITLYTFSDFYHDCEGKETEIDIKNIKNKKRELIENIVHNCFIDNHYRKETRGGTYILEANPDFEYEAFFFLDSNSENNNVPVRKVFTNKLWFYLHKYDEDINTEFRLIFPDDEKYIRSHNTITTQSSDIKKFYINKNLVDKGTIKKFGKNDNTIILKFKGRDLPKEKPTFEIIHSDIHYFVKFDFMKEWNRSWKYLLPLLTLIIGILLGAGNLWKSNEHKIL